MSILSVEGWLQNKINAGRNHPAYAHYLNTRAYVLSILSRNDSPSVSHYWQEELAGFEYLFDASPLIIQNLRHHCYHITGIRNYEYRRHHNHRAGAFKQKLRDLQALDSNQRLFVGESSALGGFGFPIDGQLINIDTLKFYEFLIGLQQAGFLAPFEKIPTSTSNRPVVLEIGSGWGGFAYQFKTLFPQSTYVLVDLPGTLLFSITYLKTLFPDARFLELTEGPVYLDRDTMNAYDFIVVPHLMWQELQMEQLDLALNMISFQEMTSEQVEGYVSRLATELECPRFYSLNRDVSAHNTELTSVSGIIKRYYQTQPIQVLARPYTQLEDKPTKVPKKFSWGRRLKNSLRDIFSPHRRLRIQTKSTGDLSSEKNKLAYRHLACLRQEH
jgi:putative sugar O-methyltransferase